MALVWISPHQVQASTIEEAVGTLSACISSGPNWLYILAQLYKGSNHTPLPKGKHLGILPQGKAEESPYGWISQLKVCQLLSTGPQVIYPVALNGGNQPVTINLPEPLYSGSSITTDEHPHMRIDITLLPQEEPELTTLPQDGVHNIPAATTPKTPWKPRITLMAEVNDLINRAMVDDSSCKSEHSTTGKVAAAEAVMSLPHKLEVPAPAVDTSSQASMEEGEASLQSNPVDISPIVAMYSSCSGSPMVDLIELQMDANLATDHMLSVKRSMDLKRQWVIWELGLLLCQNEAKEAASNEKAKVVHSWEVLDAKVDCTKAVLEGKCNYRVAIQEAKTIGGNWLQELEIAYSKALGEAMTMRSSQSVTLHREHVRLMQELEEQAIREESKSRHDFLSACQAILRHALQPLKENLTTSYHVLLGRSPPSPPSAPPTRTPPVEEQPSAAASPRSVPKWSPWLKRWHPSPEPQGEHIYRWDFPKGHTRGTIQFQEMGDSHLVCLTQTQLCRGLQPRIWHHERSQIMFLFQPLLQLGHWWHQWPFWCLQGTSRECWPDGRSHLWNTTCAWTGPEELKQANYALQSLPKGLRFLRAVPATESPKVMGLMDIHDPDALWCYTGYTYCSLVWEGGAKWGNCG